MTYLSQCLEHGQKWPSDRTGGCSKCGSAGVAAPLDPRDWGWDIETYPNAFTATFRHALTDTKYQFEISFRRNDYMELVEFIMGLKARDARGVGYNNIGFDYPVLHWIIANHNCSAAAIYQKAMSIIKSADKFGHMIWPRDRLFEQLDLYKIHHFDNAAKANSLKQLEMWMRSDNVKDLPFEVGKTLTSSEIDQLLIYNDHDVKETLKFYTRTLGMIELREGLSEKFNQDFMNCSDVKMGELILCSELEKAGVQLYEQVGGRRHKRQTFRDSINLGEVIFPYVRFEHPEFERIRAHLASQTIRETKGVFKGLIATVGGIDYAFGTGGIHASVNSCVIESTETMQVVDVDVASFYPNLGIVNKLYPAHLGTEFCDAYLGVYQTRKTYPKKSQENGAFKLALNGAYGGSNNEYSPFYDPFYTMSITINGQLLLCMLVEQLIKTPGLKMIQANTDGVTYYCPREYLDHTRNLCRWWEQLTGLELEEALYKSMHIRDVNSYMSVYDSGDVKRIGCYAYETAEEAPGTRELPYHKDWSARVVAMAAEAALVRGEDIRTFIENHPDNYDFMLRAKVPRASSLVMRWCEGYDEPLQNIIRYFVSKTGGSLYKISPPTGELGTWKRKNGISDSFYHGVIREISGQPGELDSAGTPHDERIHTKSKSKHVVREMGISVGWLVTDCSDIADFDRSQVNYDYYIAEAEKIVKPLLTGRSI